MKITKIEIQNFRSIGECLLDLEKFNIFIGQNNHGKTNFFNAIEWFYNGGNPSELVRINTKEMYVKITFSDLQDGVNSMKEGALKTKIINHIGDKAEITLIRKSDKPASLNYLEDEEIKSFGTGIDKSILSFLPKLQFVKTDTKYDDLVKYKSKSPISEMLAGILDEILENESKDYKDFKQKFNELFGDGGSIGNELIKIGENVKKYLNKQFDTSKVAFETNLPEFSDIFKTIDTKIDDGFETKANEKGDGMQRALMLAIIQTYADFRRENEESRDFIFLIDEGELHLHPTAQRNLKSALNELALSGDQILLSTHSSVIISDTVTSQAVFKVEKIEGNTNIFKVNENDMIDITYDLLGGSPQDIFLPSNFIIVEGKSELELIKCILSRFYPAEKQIKILPAFGDVDQTEKLFVQLEKIYTVFADSLYSKRVILLLDKVSDERDSAFMDFKEKFPSLSSNQQLFELPVSNLEEYYPEMHENQKRQRSGVEKWKRTEEESKKMPSKDKIKLAKIVGEDMYKEQFEAMEIIKNAIEKCIENKL